MYSLRVWHGLGTFEGVLLGSCKDEKYLLGAWDRGLQGALDVDLSWRPGQGNGKNVG